MQTNTSPTSTASAPAGRNSLRSVWSSPAMHFVRHYLEMVHRDPLSWIPSGGIC